MTRAEVLAALRTALADELAAVASIAAEARDEATGGESRQEGKYDTRATEASYLARGQAWRVVELRQLSTWFDNLADDASPDVVGLGAIVQLEGDREEWLVLAPVGGARATVAGTEVRVISPRSPLGSALVGLEVDDGVEVVTPRGRVEVAVAALL